MDPVRGREGLAPIGFAHRGARDRERENTLAAFTTALACGASGLESDAWVTADGVAVLDHDGVVRSGVRRRDIRDLRRADLPSHIPALAELYDTCGWAYELSLDIKDPAAAAPVVAVAREAGGAEALRRLWLCSPSWELAASWRELSPDVRLVDSTRITKIKEGPERRAATLAARGVDAVNLHHTDWTAGTVALFHRFDLHSFAWDCQFERVLAAVLAMGIDGVFSDDVDLMMAAVAFQAR